MIEFWKRVNKNNLPDTEVLAIGYQQEMLVGYLRYDAIKGAYCENEHEVLPNVSGYIETKTLRNMGLEPVQDI